MKINLRRCAHFRCVWLIRDKSWVGQRICGFTMKHVQEIFKGKRMEVPEKCPFILEYVVENQ
jgi:hypothetical protein